jgi:hypothetical protein
MSDFDDEDYFDDETPSQERRYFLGMTPVQRFVIAVMVLMITCIIGTFYLLVTEKVVPGFIF